MATYKLDETPDIFICPYFYDKFIFKMVKISKSETDVIRDINLRKDKLIVHGTEINESIVSKLSDSLHLTEKEGKVYVNCNGACYIYVKDKGAYRSIDNIIFDWSRYGVIVPNSVNDVLKKQLQHKDQELVAISIVLSSVKGEVEELRKQLSTSQKDEQDKEMELQKLSCKISVKEFELEATKNKLELSKEQAKELKEQFSCSKKESGDVKTKHRNMQDGLSSVQAQLQSIKMELESSNKNILKELECLLSSCMKQDQDIVTELQKLRNELSSSNVELQLTKSQLEFTGKRIKELEDELSTCKTAGKAKEEELHSMKMNELQSIKILFEPTQKMEDNSFGECYDTKGTETVDDVIVD